MQLRSGELTVETVGYHLRCGVGSSCEGDALILCRLLGFTVNSFDRPPQLGDVVLRSMLSTNYLHCLLL